MVNGFLQAVRFPEMRGDFCIFIRYFCVIFYVYLNEM